MASFIPEVLDNRIANELAPMFASLRRSLLVRVFKRRLSIATPPCGMPSARPHAGSSAGAVVRFDVQNPRLVNRKILDNYISELRGPDPYGFSVDRPRKG
jgi:hypothetical protein